MKTNPSKKQLQEFGILLGFGFPIIIGWLIPTISGHIFRSWALWVGFTSLVLGILKPGLLLYPYKGWMTFGLVIGKVNSRIILGLVHLMILQPIAIIMKIFGYDPLGVKKSNKKSYREIKKYKKFDFKKIF